MTQNAERRYQMLLADLFQLRARGEDETNILDQLDTVWFTLSSAEIARVNAMCARIARHRRAACGPGEEAMTCRGCGPSPDPEQDREHNDWCPDNPRRTHRGKDDAAALRVENERLRAALADIARGDYSDPLCMRTPEQRAREALAPKKEKP